MTTASSEMLHATSVSIGGQAVLIEGLPGSGKSDLALRLIDRGAILVSDDYTLVKRDGAALVATVAPNIAGRIEVRGIGIVETPYRDAQPVRLIVSLSAPVARMPAEDLTRRIAGIEIPAVALEGHEASAPIKVELALKQALA